MTVDEDADFAAAAGALYSAALAGTLNADVCLIHVLEHEVLSVSPSTHKNSR